MEYSRRWQLHIWGCKMFELLFRAVRAFSAIFFAEYQSYLNEWVLEAKNRVIKVKIHPKQKWNFLYFKWASLKSRIPKMGSQNREFSKWASPIQVLLAGLFQEFLLWASPFRELLIWACPFREFLFWASSFQEFLIWCRPLQIFSLLRWYSSKKLVQNVHNLCEIGA